MCKLLGLGFAMLAGLFYFSGAVELGNLFLAALFFITILYIITKRVLEQTSLESQEEFFLQFRYQKMLNTTSVD